MKKLNFEDWKNNLSNSKNANCYNNKKFCGQDKDDFYWASELKKDDELIVQYEIYKYKFTETLKKMCDLALESKIMCNEDDYTKCTLPKGSCELCTF